MPVHTVLPGKVTLISIWTPDTTSTRKIVVKVNAPQLARKELAAPKWQGEHVAMGTNVDCYQRAEGRYRLMPGIIEALRDAANPFSILTKGTLILRDLDLLAEAAEVTDVGLNVSVGFVDKEISRSRRAGNAQPGAPAGGLRRAERARAAVRGADGAGAAVPHRLPRPAGADRAAGRRGRCNSRHPDRAAPAAGSPRVVPAAGSARTSPTCWTPTAACTAGAHTRQRATRHRSPSRSGNWPAATGSARPPPGRHAASSREPPSRSAEPGPNRRPSRSRSSSPCCDSPSSADPLTRPAGQRPARRGTRRPGR